MTKRRKKNTILEKIRKNPHEHAEGLAKAIISDALSRKLIDIVDAKLWASIAKEAVLASSQQKSIKELLEKSFSEALEKADEIPDEPIRNLLPDEITELAGKQFSYPYRMDPELIRALLVHRRIKSMLREALQNLLFSFGRSFLSAIPSSGLNIAGRSARLAGIMDVAGKMAGMVKSELDRQLEGKVRDFVEDMLDRGIEKWALQLSSPENAKKMAETRLEILEVFLEQPPKYFFAIPKTADISRISDSISECIDYLAEWDELDSYLEKTLHKFLDVLGDTSLEELINAELAKALRPSAEKALAAQIESFFESDFFADWLSDSF